MMYRKAILLIVALSMILVTSACGGGCEGVKSRACCTEGNENAPGDCADLIISHRYDQCAFVDDITGCKPPREWTTQPNGWSAADWLCPASYEWVGNLDCSGD